MGSISLDSGSNVHNRSVKKDSSDSNSEYSVVTHETQITTQASVTTVKETTENKTEHPVVKPVLTATQPSIPASSGQSENKTAPANFPPKPFEGLATILFVTVFAVGLIGVVMLFLWKSGKETTWRAPATYQYSVLNNFENEPEDELGDPLRVGDDFIITNDSSDD